MNEDNTKKSMKFLDFNFEKNWIIECCKLAGAHKFITNLPNGYQTNVGERGLSLSGGQIQRICIARAFIRNGDLMIFDEATSALDKRNEQKIFDVFYCLAFSRFLLFLDVFLTFSNMFERFRSFF